MIKNSDMPAMPLSNEMSSDLDSAIGSPDRYGFPTATGLTKREAFEMAAMQGLLSNRSIIDNHDKEGIEWISKHARDQADSMLKELDNEQI